MSERQIEDEETIKQPDSLKPYDMVFEDFFTSKLFDFKPPDGVVYNVTRRDELIKRPVIHIWSFYAGSQEEADKIADDIRKKINEDGRKTKWKKFEMDVS